MTMSNTWQAQLADAYIDPLALLKDLGINPNDLPEKIASKTGFAFKVTRSFAARMKPGDPLDPLLRQVLPSLEEDKIVPGFHRDPVGDLEAIEEPGLLHKYQGRVLLITTGACAIHCRYCFRRNFPYQEQQLAKRRESISLERIKEDPSISEVILSGGDPLVLSNDRLRTLIAAIAAIPSVERLRLHTRLPIVLPSRIDPELRDILQSTRLKVIVVIHANHSNEINDEVHQALEALSLQGITLLNQTVLLKGINDDADLLSDLSHRLFEGGVLPYYLHLLDRAQGTHHFEVEEAKAKAIYEGLLSRLPGYLVPKMVREEKGAPSKIPLLG
ncbi:MAG: EF-P beta-lysylation protein EpmB [Methylococcus sp.]|jgi:EF-P beta-lysylation protein EpmB